MRYTTSKILVNLESVAFTDIIMNMFIFFFITFSLVYVPAAKEKGIKVDLPKGKSGAPETKGLVISITKKDPDIIYFNGDAIPLENLSEKLKQSNVSLKDEPITLRCDKDVNVERMIKVMDIARGEGASKLNIAIESAKVEQN